MRGGEFLLGENVHRVLVLGAMIHARNETEFVERPANERALEHQPGQPHVAGGLQVNLIERARQVVRAVAAGAFAERFGIRDGGLAAVAKCRHRIANLLNLRQR